MQACTLPRGPHDEQASASPVRHDFDLVFFIEPQ